VSVTGDFAALARLVRGLGDVSTLRLELGGSLRQGLGDAYAQQFARGSSSTGAAWPAPKSGGRPLYRSGALSRATVRVAMGRGGSLAEGRVVPRTGYARYYLRDPRRILPTSEADLGTFGERVERDVPAAMRRWLEELL
jgi:hypothetical protein